MSESTLLKRIQENNSRNLPPRDKPNRNQAGRSLFLGREYNRSSWGPSGMIGAVLPSHTGGGLRTGAMSFPGLLFGSVFCQV